MPFQYRWPLLALILCLNPACAVYETWPGGSRSENNEPAAPVSRPVPVRVEPPAAEEPPVTQNPSAPQVPVTVAQPTGPAGFLLEEASRQRASGDYQAAATSVERAMRIQPGNPWLSLELARVRLDQGNNRQAELLAQRALTQAGGDRALRATCWRVTAAAREAAGDTNGAAVALSRAGE
ncbi:MAG: tetratricopeptide repeat protein [Gammaproteobacteria bacterium]